MDGGDTRQNVMVELDGTNTSWWIAYEGWSARKVIELDVLKKTESEWCLDRVGKHAAMESSSIRHTDSNKHFDNRIKYPSFTLHFTGFRSIIHSVFSHCLRSVPYRVRFYRLFSEAALQTIWCWPCASVILGPTDLSYRTFYQYLQPSLKSRLLNSLTSSSLLDCVRAYAAPMEYWYSCSINSLPNDNGIFIVLSANSEEMSVL